MNILQILIISFLIGNALLEILVDALNIRNLKTSLPKEFKSRYKPQKYKQSQQYLKEKTVFIIVQNLVNTSLTVAFIILGGFNVLDLWARSYGFNEIGTGLLFILTLVLVQTVLSLPFSIFSTFVIEEKFGFNKTTPRTFAIDTLKSLGLTLAIASPIIGLLLWFFTTTGESAWFISWLVITSIQLFLVLIAPIWIMPLFNKFIPLKKGELKTAIEKFAKNQDFQLSGIFTMDGSKRSTKSNAFFTGFGPYKRIVLFDTLIKDLTTPELVSVLAHEIGHYKHKHIHKMIFISMITTGFMLYSFSLLINNQGIFEAFRMEHLSIYASLVFIIILFSPVNQIISIATNAFSRKNEFEADKYAIQTHQQPKAFSSALKKLTVKNLGNLNPHPLKVWLEYSHPPVLERIKKINSLSS